jgi:hypothetical protein
MNRIAIAMLSSVLLSGAALAATGTTGAMHASAPSHPVTAAPRTTAAKNSTTTHTTGQPNQSCGSATAPNTPGNAASAPGSAFNPDGTAGTKYAGEQPQNSKNPVSVSQYDAACAHQNH